MFGNPIKHSHYPSLHNISDSTFEILADKSALFTSLHHFFLFFLFCWIDGLILVSFSVTPYQPHTIPHLWNTLWNVPFTTWNKTKAATQDRKPSTSCFLPLPRVKPAPVQLLKDTRNKQKSRDRWNSERERKRETEGVRKKVQGIPVVLSENGIAFMDLLRTRRSSYMALRVTCSDWTWGSILWVCCWIASFISNTEKRDYASFEIRYPDIEPCWFQILTEKQ